MELNLSLLGTRAGPFNVSCTSDDALIYALGVGAGQVDPYAELDLTTENTLDVPQRVLPSFAIVLAQRENRLRIDLGDIDRTKLVHAEQDLTLTRDLPTSGTLQISSELVSITDKGSGALIVTEYVAVDPADGGEVFRSHMTAFLKGAGGFVGGQPSAASLWQKPDRAPDATISAATRTDQALIYRLSGDRNPLHTDPDFARRGGFSRPILHGLCTYGITSRVLLNRLGDPTTSMRRISGRFTAPVFPGDHLEVHTWKGADGLNRYQTLNGQGVVVIDRGLFEITDVAS